MGTTHLHMAKFVTDGTLTKAPLYAGALWWAFTAYAILAGAAFLQTVLLCAALIVSSGFLLCQLNSTASGVFWLLNTFNAWLCPTMFRCLDHVLNRAIKGDPASVAKEIDAFCWGGNMIMNVGDVKGQIVDAEIKKHAPKLLLELGAHMGYSTVRFAGQMPRDGLLHSVEPEPMGHAVGMALLRYAGVADKVVAEYDYSGNVLRRFAKEGKKIDMLFIDHVKELYLDDLKLALSLGVLPKGAVVIADNVLTPGAPDYKEWMLHGEGKKFFKTVVHDTFVEYSKSVKDEVLVSIYQGDADLAGTKAAKAVSSTA